MKNRIKYKEISENVYESCKLFVAEKSGGVYKVILDLNTKTYKVINVKQRTIVKSSEKDNKSCNNLIVLKRQAKKALKELGVKFDLEIRNSQNTGVQLMHKKPLQDTN